MKTAHNLSTGKTLVYGYTLPARSAVLCAYAQGTANDYNTWDYAQRYGHLVERAEHHWVCGNWVVKVDTD